MKPFAPALLLAVTLVTLFPLPASAEYLSCKNQSVNVGDTRAALLQRCGEPALKDTFCKPVESQAAPASNGVNVVVPTCRNVDEWTYNPGRGQFMTTLQIDAGKVTSIQYGDRVQ
jgi:hypothetical protein